MNVIGYLSEVAGSEFSHECDLGLWYLVLVPGGVLQGVAPTLLRGRLRTRLSQLAAQTLQIFNYLGI